jgi:uncharacterized protein YqgC (DUF456 family)
MLNNTLLIIASVLVVLGVIGSILPVLPGPTLSYIGLICLYFVRPGSVSVVWLVIFAAALILLTVINYLMPIWGSKFAGASKKGLTGAIVGSLIGIIFFPPLGIFVGAFLGAFLGELAGGKQPPDAIRAGIGTFLGNVSVIILQLVFSLTLAVYFFIRLFSA